MGGKMKKIIGILSLLFICLVFSGCIVKETYINKTSDSDALNDNFFSKEGCQNQCQLRGFETSYKGYGGYRNPVCNCISKEGLMSTIYEW